MAAMTTIQKVLLHLDKVLMACAVLKSSPLHSDFRRGYEAAMREMLAVATKIQEDEDDAATDSDEGDSP